MIDLHCHMLPGIDDGAPDLDSSLAMARIAVDDGIRVTACTPHIYPGLYENSGPDIRQRVAQLQAALDDAGIRMELSLGADTHLTPDLVSGIRSGRIPTLGDTRYFLLEPPHHVAPPHFDEFVFNVMAAGYIPVITHPERLTWVADHYPLFEDLAHSGAWMQVTSGSLTGRFGSAAQQWAERFLDDGITHILATDAHSVDRRPPLLAEGRDAAALHVGEQEAENLVSVRPRGMLDNADPTQMPPVPWECDGASPAQAAQPAHGGLFSRLFRKAG